MVGMGEGERGRRRYELFVALCAQRSAAWLIRDFFSPLKDTTGQHLCMIRVRLSYGCMIIVGVLYCHSIYGSWGKLSGSE